MKPIVVRAATEAPAAADRGGGVRTVALVTPARGASQFLNGTTEFDPGSSLPLHWHNCEESVTVLTGRATFECCGRMVEMLCGDTTWVPQSLPHRFLNASDEVMRILWMYGRTDATRTMAETGETFSVGTERISSP